MICRSKNIRTKKAELLRAVGEVALYEYILSQVYGKPVEINGRFHGKSPIRGDDDRPSFSIFYASELDRWKWKDFGRDQGGDVFDLFSAIFGVNFEVSVGRLYEIFIERKEVKINTKTRKNNTVKKSDVRIKIFEYDEPMPWQVEYWQQYGLPIEYLKEHGVRFVREAIVFSSNKNFHLYDSRMEPMFAYDYNGRYKIYRPLSTRGKWFQNIPNNTTEIFYVNRRRCYITTSKKDAMCWHYHNNVTTGYIQSETNIDEEFWGKLLEEYEEVYYIADNDKAGWNFAMKLGWKFERVNILLPPTSIWPFEKSPVKDVADYYKNQTLKLNNNGRKN